MTYAGKWVTAITAIFSVAVFAVPAGLLGWGFESVGEKFIEQRKEKIKRKKRAVDVHINNTININPVVINTSLFCSTTADNI